MFSSGAVDEHTNAERGAATALERLCNLEARLRQALQSSGPLHTIFATDKRKEDRELVALRTVQYAQVPCNTL